MFENETFSGGFSGVAGGVGKRQEKRKKFLFLDKKQNCAILLFVIMFLRGKITIIYIQTIN